MMADIFNMGNWLGVFVGVFLSMYYFISQGLPCCSLLHLNKGQALTGNDPIRTIAFSYLLNVLFAFPSVLVLYEAAAPQQFGFASISFISIISGHMTFRFLPKSSTAGG